MSNLNDKKKGSATYQDEEPQQRKPRKFPTNFYELGNDKIISAPPEPPSGEAPVDYDAYREANTPIAEDQIEQPKPLIKSKSLT